MQKYKCTCEAVCARNNFCANSHAKYAMRAEPFTFKCLPSAAERSFHARCAHHFYSNEESLFVFITHCLPTTWERLCITRGVLGERNREKSMDIASVRIVAKRVFGTRAAREHETDALSFALLSILMSAQNPCRPRHTVGRRGGERVTQNNPCGICAPAPKHTLHISENYVSRAHIIYFKTWCVCDAKHPTSLFFRLFNSHCVSAMNMHPGFLCHGERVKRDDCVINAMLNRGA
jgi:hypothetical protein